jgi:hypothetical protein
MIELESSEQNGDTVAWEWFKDLLEHLQAEGMSSEESDVEGYQVRYRVKTKPWRHPDIALCMEGIDDTKPVEMIRDGRLISTRPPADGFPEAFLQWMRQLEHNIRLRGSKPVKRIRDGTLISTRPHVDGLPEAFYDPQWMTANNMRLRVSDKPFQWLRWKGQTASSH